MSMPQPIRVALVGATAEQVRTAKKPFRLNRPGMGPAFYAAIDASDEQDILPISSLADERITLWVCLDKVSYKAAMDLHKKDLAKPHYERGFYDTHLPDACILVPKIKSKVDFAAELRLLADRIGFAWESTG